MARLGIVYTPDRPPEGIAVFARLAETAGLDELWLWEDCFLTGGIAASATALAATSRITIGLGVMPAVFRNPAAAAMEIATLARIHRGDSSPGSGTACPSGWTRSARSRRDRSERWKKQPAPCAACWPARP